MNFILALKTDTSEAQIALYEDGKEIKYKKWEAGRELSTQINSGIKEICESARITLHDLSGIIVFEGPGSYTGLRISISVANALGYSLNKPVAGSSGDQWFADGIVKLKSISNFKPVLPVYGGEVFTTNPKK